MNKLKFGNFLCKLRMEKGLTQEKLAEKLNINSSKTISKWECGNSIPDFETMEELSKEFNVSLFELSIGERIPEKILAKEEIPKVVIKKKIYQDFLKHCIKYLGISFIVFIILFCILYTCFNFNRTKVYKVNSVNGDYIINGTIVKTRKYSVLSINKILYSGDKLEYYNTKVKRIGYIMYNNDKVIGSNGGIADFNSLSEGLESLSIYSYGKNIRKVNNHSKLNLVIDYTIDDEKETNNIITIPLEIIDLHNDLLI